MDIAESILQGVAAVVTGGTKGVGRGVAHELARRGARVFVTGRSASDRDAIEGQTTLRTNGASAHPVSAWTRFHR